MTGRQDLPEIPAEAARRDGTALAHMLIVSDIQRAVRFYRDVLGATIIREGEPAILRLCHGWLISTSAAARRPTSRMPR
jgi:extradiol dioxygenase family protein